MQYIDGFLNRITMYRLTLYYLIVLVGLAVVFSFLGLLSYNPLDILISTGIALIAGFAANFVFAKLFRAVTNVESVFITALILVLIVPTKLPLNAGFIAFAAVAAMASKYFLTIEKRHVFNPAAAAIAGIALLSPEHSATWWVGTPWMWPFVLVGGLLLMRKIRRESLIFTFLTAYLFLIAASSYWHSGSLASILTIWQASIFHSALLFFTFVMLTEPLTSPATEKLQDLYAYVTAFFYATVQFRVAGIALTPETALCLSNVFSYFISPNYRLALPLKWKRQLSPDTLVFAFDKTQNIKYSPGQYMEWTLPHSHADSRGNRRYFSLASSPTESELLMAVKFYNPSSSYKQNLLQMQSGQPIIASQVAGDFVLPKNLRKPLVFVAGGVGIAPFRSMIQYIVDNKLQSDIILLYANRRPEDILFVRTFDEAQKYGVRVFYILTDKSALPQDWLGGVGHVTAEMIQRVIPDYTKRTFYLSGPQPMVESFERTLAEMQIAKKNVKTDFFPGYVE